MRNALLHADLREQIVETIKRETAKTGADEGLLAQLRQERGQIRNQIEFVIEELGSIGREVAKTKIKQLESRLASLNDRIEHASHSRTTNDQINPNADEIVAQLSEIGSILRSTAETCALRAD